MSERYYHPRSEEVWRLRTGGRAGSERQNLFVFSAGAGAWRLLAQEEFGDNELGDTTNLGPIAATRISIGGLGHLGSEGNLWVRLPDNQDIDVTPTVQGEDYYTFGQPGFAKYHPYITANNINLETNTPEFCVGQQVTFQLRGLPGAVDTQQGWTLPGTYVNQQTNYSSSCVTYVQNGSLLATNPTSCWFVNGSGGTVGVWQNLHFSNGQYVSVAADGDISVYRPSITNFSYGSPRSFLMTNDVMGNYELVYGNSNRLPPDFYGTRWDATINSKYEGSWGITQLIKAREGAFLLTWIYNFDSTAEAVADGAEFYNSTHTNLTQVELQDFPCIAPDLSWNWTSLEVYFEDSQDYIRFKPNGDGIYVTLGIVDWKAHGLYSRISGWQTNSAPAPSAPDVSDNFPLWKQIHPEN